MNPTTELECAKRELDSIKRLKSQALMEYGLAPAHDLGSTFQTVEILRRCERELDRLLDITLISETTVLLVDDVAQETVTTWRERSRLEVKLRILSRNTTRGTC